MAKRRYLVSEPEIDEVSLVDKTDNPPARFVLAKRRGMSDGDDDPDDDYEDDAMSKALVVLAKFAGSPRNKYGTHSSKGFKGSYEQAWRIHFSQIGGGATTAGAGGPIRGTVRRVAMIAAGMKPPCQLPSTEGAAPRGGGKSPLPGSFPEKPSDYGLDRWASPSDDDLTAEDVTLSCKDLATIKRAAAAEVAWRAAQREKEEEKVGKGGAVKRLTALLAKAFGSAGTELDSDELESGLDELAIEMGLKPGAGGPDTKEGGMDKKIDLSKKLSDEDRAVVEKALEAAKEVDELKAKVAELEKGKEPEKKEPTKEELLKDVPDSVIKLFEARDAVNKAELEKRDKIIAKLTADAEREAFEKTLDLPNIAAKRPDLAKVLFDLPPEKRDEVVKLLKAADGQVAQSAEIMKTIGVDGGGDSERTVTAKSKMDAVVAEIRKADPKLTAEQAYAEALDRHPELYEDLHSSLN